MRDGSTSTHEFQVNPKRLKRLHHIALVALVSEYVCTRRKELIQAMLKFSTTIAKGEVNTEVLAGSVRTVATLAYA